jgi:hypothetical protein
MLHSLVEHLPCLSTWKDASNAAVMAEVNLWMTSSVSQQSLTFWLRALSHAVRSGLVQVLNFVTKFCVKL